MNSVFEIKRNRDPYILLRAVVNRVNHRFARHNISSNPQLAILSFDHIGLTINIDGQYERSSLGFIEELLVSRGNNLQKSIALDIGANIGNHSVFFSKHFKQVHAFEPNPIIFELLKFNAAYAPSRNNISVYNFGLSDKHQKLNFEINHLNLGGSRIKPETSSSNQETKQMKVLTRIADEIMEFEKEHIALVKIDVEGHELRALRGAVNIIRQHKPLILFEQSASEINDGSSEVVDFLRSLGYDICVPEHNINFGNSYFGKFSSLVFRSILGYKIKLIAKNSLKKQFYEMIVAMPKKQV